MESESLSRITFLAESDVENGAVVPETGSAPAEMPGCPARTELLASAQFTNGWVLICGVNGQPSYLAAHLPGETSPQYSQGQKNPTSQATRDAVKRDEHFERYTAAMENGEFFVLENDTGTASVWPSEAAAHEASGEPVATWWVVRIFVLLYDTELRNLRPGTAGADRGSRSNAQAATEKFVIPACNVMNPVATRTIGATPQSLSQMYGPVVRGALQQAPRVTGCQWNGPGTVMQWVSEVTPVQKEALIDGMLDFGYRAEADGALLRVSFSEMTGEGLETHTHVFDGDAWLFIYQLGVEAEFEESATLALSTINPARFE